MLAADADGVGSSRASRASEKARSQVWFSASAARMRSVLLLTISRFTKSLASSLTPFQRGPRKAYAQAWIFMMTVRSSLPKKGIWLESSMKAITPMLQLSEASSEAPSMTSGAMLYSVPTDPFSTWPGAYLELSPKSITLIFASLDLEANMMFSNFRSRWTTPLAWQ